MTAKDKTTENKTTAQKTTVLHVSDDDFDKVVLASSLPVLVDVWADWCGPCRTIAPLVEEIATEYKGRLTVAKLDADANPSTAQRFGVRGLPTLLIFRDGKPVASKIGAISKPMIAAWIDETL